jgi:hypothetical protein
MFLYMNNKGSYNIHANVVSETLAVFFSNMHAR